MRFRTEHQGATCSVLPVQISQHHGHSDSATGAACANEGAQAGGRANEVPPAPNAGFARELDDLDNIFEQLIKDVEHEREGLFLQRWEAAVGAKSSPGLANRRIGRPVLNRRFDSISEPTGEAIVERQQHDRQRTRDHGNLRRGRVPGMGRRATQLLVTQRWGRSPAARLDTRRPSEAADAIFDTIKADHCLDFSNLLRVIAEVYPGSIG